MTTRIGRVSNADLKYYSEAEANNIIQRDHWAVNPKDMDKYFPMSDRGKRVKSAVHLTSIEELVSAIERDDKVYDPQLYYVKNIFNNDNLRVKFPTYKQFVVETNRIDRKLNYMMKQDLDPNGRQTFMWCEEFAVVSKIEYEIWKHRFDHIFQSHEVQYAIPGQRINFFVGGKKFKLKDKSQYTCRSCATAKKNEKNCCMQLVPSVYRREARYALEGHHKKQASRLKDVRTKTKSVFYASLTVPKL